MCLRCLLSMCCGSFRHGACRPLQLELPAVCFSVLSCCFGWRWQHDRRRLSTLCSRLRTGLRSNQLERSRRTLHWRREAGKLLEAAIRFGHRWHQTNAEETETTNLLENLENSGCVLELVYLLGVTKVKGSSSR